MRKLDQNPELKQAYETLVKHLPEDQREKTMVSIASRTMRSITPRQTPVPWRAHGSDRYQNQSVGLPKTLRFFASNRSVRCLASKPRDFGLPLATIHRNDVAAARRRFARPHRSAKIKVGDRIEKFETRLRIM